MTSDTISYTVNNGIATLSINRPEVMNAFRIEEFEYFINGVTLAEHDPEVKVIKIKSAGDRVFSGGLDLNMVSEFGSNPSKLKELLATGDKIVDLFVKSKKPIVVQVQGPAVGWGCILCLYADFVIAGDNPKTFFVLNEIEIGLFPGTGALSAALLQTNLKMAKRMLLIPERIKVDDAEKLNLISKKVFLQDLESETEKFCQTLAQRDLQLLTSIKGLLNILHMQDISKFIEKEKKTISFLLEGKVDELFEYYNSLWS